MSPTPPILTRMRSLRATPKALLVQLLALVLAMTVDRAIASVSGMWVPGWRFVLLQAIAAAGLSRLLHSDRWWLWIHLGFAPVALLASMLRIAPGWYLGLFIVLAVVYGSHFRSQVPLFLSNDLTTERLLDWVVDNQPLRFLDFGSGLGGVVRAVARQRPLAQCEGVEGALGPALLGRLMAVGQPNCTLRWGDFWKTDLQPFDVVYAFLSPVPMPALWEKACREMRPGTLLISNSFIIPGVKVQNTIEVKDKRETRLYIYRIPQLPKKFSTQ